LVLLKRAWSRATPIHVLLVVAFLELAIDRVAVPLLRPLGTPPLWHTVLDYFGLFLLYFTGTLAVLIVGVRCAAVQRRNVREMTTHSLLAIAALLAAIPLLIPQPPDLGLALELAFGVAILGFVASAFVRGGDVGSQIGLGIVAIPFLLHVCVVLGGHFLWPEAAHMAVEGGRLIDGPGVELSELGIAGLCFAALASPYCFAPRPFARAVTRPGPVVFAMAVAAVGAVASRLWYPLVVDAAHAAIGVKLNADKADRWLAIYLLGVATFAWTLASCLIAPSPARRTIGAGLALVVLGGYAFKWPHHYLLPLLGVALVAEGSRRVRDEELALLPFSSDTPPIGDTAWGNYIAAIVTGLKRTLGDVHSLTTRGEAGLTSSIVVGDKDGIPVRTRIERIDGSVLALDVVVGREVDEMRGATLTLWANPEPRTGQNPPAPPANPAFKSGDAMFDAHFKARGNVLSLMAMFEEAARARAAATLSGWFAYWEGEGVRYRVYPGRGSALDHPIPISDLALARPNPSAERLVAVVELLVEVAGRVVKPQPEEPPAELDAPPT
jgi:hypothetical protein